MTSDRLQRFTDQLLGAPAGLALLARIELLEREDLAWFRCPHDSDPTSVRLAASSVRELPLGNLLDMAVSSAEHWAGPWSGEALLSLPYLYEQGQSRRLIAEAISERFYEDLHRGLDPGSQQWWYEDFSEAGGVTTARFRDYSNVYANGEFTHDGIWTVTDPPPEVHDSLILTWDYFGRPTSRWLLPVRRDARVWNIDAPNDWARLVESYPKVATRPHEGWELPGPNQHRSDTKMLRLVTSQRAVRTEISGHLLPDWARVAEDFDAVHLSWAGFLTTEGYISDLSSGALTMMRYWGSERTLWLHDAFGEPQPLGAPHLTGRIGGAKGIDVTRSPDRQASDRSVITRLLGR